MKLFIKSLLIDGNDIYFDENNNINKIKRDKGLISLYGVKYNASDMGEDIINMIINDKHLYSYINEYFTSDCCPMSVSVTKDNKIYNYYLYKNNLIETLGEFIKNDKIKVTSAGLKNLKELTNSINLDKLKEKLNNKILTLKINNKYVNCPYNLIINFLESKDKEFYNFFDKEDNYNGLSKPMFLYMVKEFYKQYNEGYLFDSNIKERIDYIENQDNIEFVIFEKNFTSESERSVYKNIEIDQGLKNQIINNMPPNLSKLEIAIYIYIKLSKELNYDLEYYAVRQKGPIADAHKDISKVNNIDLKNKNVVCYEFNAIFAHLLNEFNIDFEIRQHGDNYGDTHAWLRVNIDNLLISFDSMHRIFWEFDLLQAKINNPLRGIKLYNKNKVINNKFNDIIEKIYRMIIKEENKDNNIKIDKYSDIVSDNSLSSFDKINLMVDKTEKLNLSDMESISYLLNMHKESLSEESDEKIEKELLIKKINSELKLCILFTSYNKYIKEDEREYIYCVYVPGEPLRRYDNETLKFYLEQGIFEIYEKNKDILIPGIDYVSKKEIDMNVGRMR